MIYLVFGGSGFLGSTLLRVLREKGEDAYAVSRRGGHKTFALDITQPDQFKTISIKPDVVINCASALPDGSQNLGDPSYLRKLYETNVIGGANIMNWAVAAGVSKVVNCSTLVVVNKPWPVPLTESEYTYPTGTHVGYSSSKLSQELVMSSIAAAHKLSLLHLRISALYGPGMQAGGILNKLLAQAAAGEQIRLKNGNNVSFDFLHVHDAAYAIYHLSKEPAWSDAVINLASGEEITLLQLAKLVSALKGRSAENIANTDEPDVVSRAKVDTSLLEKYLAGSGISTRPFARKVKTMLE